MTRRLLLAICLCLSLAAAPVALAEGDDGAPPDESACPAGVAGDDSWELDDDGEATEHDDEDEEELEEPGDDGDPCEPGGEEDLESGDDGEEDEAAEAPVFDRSFLRRSLRLAGAPTGFAGGVLTVTVSSVPRVPARLRGQAAQLSGIELAVVVGRRTKLSRTRTARGARRRGGRRVSPGALRRARRVKVEGKLLPPGRWRRDADGSRVPTLRARRVIIVG